jgi:hypothetical protein
MLPPPAKQQRGGLGYGAPAAGVSRPIQVSPERKETGKAKRTARLLTHTQRPLCPTTALSSLQLFLGVGGDRSDVAVARTLLPPDACDAYADLAASLGLDSIIVEAAYDQTVSAWSIRRVRNRKTRPNHISTGWSTLEVLSEALVSGQCQMSDFCVACLWRHNLLCLLIATHLRLPRSLSQCCRPHPARAAQAQSLKQLTDPD